MLKIVHVTITECFFQGTGNGRPGAGLPIVSGAASRSRPRAAGRLERRIWGMYRSYVGLEIHIQLLTQSKVFCGCRAAFGEEPNSNICPVCMGYPGVLPALNEEAVRQALL